jgi:hypothetical protein
MAMSHEIRHWRRILQGHFAGYFFAEDVCNG